MRSCVAAFWASESVWPRPGLLTKRMISFSLIRIVITSYSIHYTKLYEPDTIWDPSRAPDGKHLIGVEEFSAPTRFFTASQWQALRKKFEDAIIDQWQIYAPNMTRDNIIGCRVITPYDIELRRPNRNNFV